MKLTGNNFLIASQRIMIKCLKRKFKVSTKVVFGFIIGITGNGRKVIRVVFTVGYLSDGLKSGLDCINRLLYRPYGTCRATRRVKDI